MPPPRAAVELQGRAARRVPVGSRLADTEVDDFAAELHQDAAGWPAEAQQHHDGAVVAYWHERATESMSHSPPSRRV